jgi:hypothetical protein
VGRPRRRLTAGTGAEAADTGRKTNPADHACRAAFSLEAAGKLARQGPHELMAQTFALGQGGHADPIVGDRELDLMRYRDTGQAQRGTRGHALPLA